jgi:LPS export ABC transporter protein LptC
MEYGQDIEAKALARDVPDLVTVDARVRIVRDDVLVMVLESDRAETYGEAGNQVLTGVRFTQYSNDGTVTARGTAGKAVRVIQTDDVQFTGGLIVEVVSESAHIKADSLDWTAADKVLRGQAGDLVEITKENGSRIAGYGLYADLSGRTIELGGGVEGVINND